MIIILIIARICASSCYVGIEGGATAPSYVGIKDGDILLLNNNNNNMWFAGIELN